MTTGVETIQWPVDGGECGRLIRMTDWSRTALGPIGNWPVHLRVNIDTMISSPLPQVMLWGPDHVLIYNDAFIPLAGLRHPTAMGAMAPVAWSEIWDLTLPVVQSVLQGQSLSFPGQALTLISEGISQDRLFDLVYSPLHGAEGGDVDGVLCTSIEITDTARTRSALIESRAELFRLADSLPILVAVLDASLIFRFANECYLSVFGLTADQIVDRGVDAVLSPVETALAQDSMRKALAGHAVIMDIAVALPDDEKRLFELRYLPRRNGAEAVDGIYMILIDIEDRKRHEIELRHSNDRFRAAVRAVHSVLWTNTPDGRMMGEQPAWSALTGQLQDQFKDYGWAERVHPDDRTASVASWNKAVASRMTYEWEHRLRCADDEYRIFQVRAVPLIDRDDVLVEWVGVHTDVSDQRMSELQLHAHAEDLQRQIRHRERAEDQLRQLNETLEVRVADEISERRKTERALQQAQKMETLGQLTGGIAHDFNNLLQVVAGNLQLLVKDVAGDARASTRVQNALAGVERGAKLSSQLLAFGRRQPLEPRVVKPGRLVSGMSDLLRRSLGEGVTVDVTVPQGLWNTCVDAAQLENALLNLAINARDAMSGGGRLTIALENVQLDTVHGVLPPDVLPGGYVRLSVSDTGCGMAPEVVDRIFEPFFSTKPEGRGTGLGMSMVYGFVKQSGGDVTVDSIPGVGTTVNIFLPRTTSEAADDLPVLDGPVIGGLETVLVVEDDDAVRATVVDLLGSLGYKVLTARDAQAGLSVIESGVALDVLFTDVVMPGTLTSREMARRAQDSISGVAVLFTSGYAEDSIVHGGRLDTGIELLSKPYTREALARRLRHVIGNAKQTAGIRIAQPQKQAAPVAGHEQRQAPTDALSILLVEDNALIRADTAAMLAEMGHSVTQAGKGYPALSLVKSDQRIDLLLTDLGLPDMRGEELATLAVEVRTDLAIVFATGDTAVPDGSPAQVVLLPKPYGEMDLRRAVRKAWEARPGVS